MYPAVIIESKEQLAHILTNSSLPSDLLLEFRIDKDPTLLDQVPLQEESVQQRIILTLRSTEEGGSSKLSLEDRHSLLQQLLAHPVGYVDLEFARDLPLYEQHTQALPQIILSQHNYQLPMFEAGERFIQSTLGVDGEYIIKFVGKATDSYEVVQTLEYFMQHAMQKYICLAINEAGEVARTHGNYYRNYLAFGGLQEHAPFSLADLLATQHEDAVLTGLLGKSLQHTLSPQIHHIFRQQHQRSGYYHRFEVSSESRVQQFLPSISAIGLQGINVTFPYKKTVLTVADSISPEAEAVQAANTITFETCNIIAHNTDVSGFRKALQQFTPIKEISDALVLGAGGSARAVAHALLQEGIIPTIVYRNERRLKEFPEDLANQVAFQHISSSPPWDFQLFVNATPLGLDQTSSPEDVMEIPLGAKLFDLVYSATGTPLTRKYQEQAIDGTSMLFHQAADAYELWTGFTINREHAYTEFLSHVNRSTSPKPD